MPTTTQARAAGLLAAAALLAAGTAASARTDLPVHQTVLPDGVTRYSVPITVGDGAPIEAELDTGSFGLRVLKDALAPSQYAATDMRRDYAFGGGARFDGVLARAVLGVGPVRTDGPALFHLIETVGCTERKPDCFAARVSAADYGIGGDGYAKQGFKAILGLSMRRAATDDSAQNPLAAAGKSWILVLPRPGESEPGHLIVDPDPDERAGFAPMQLRPEGELSGRLSGWADSALPGCLVPEDGGPKLCGQTVIDSGAPAVVVGTDTVSEPGPWGRGKRARIEIGGPTGPAQVAFTSGDDKASRVFLHPPREGAEPQLSAGTLPFMSYAVLYDAAAGTMGFKPRAPAAP